MYVNVNSAIRKVSKVYANVSGTIKAIKNGYVNDNGTLRKFISPSLLGLEWKAFSPTTISVNTSTQLKFSATNSGEGEYPDRAYASVYYRIPIPAGAKVRLTGTVSASVEGPIEGGWSIDGGSTAIATGALSKNTPSTFISRTYSVSEAGSMLTLRAYCYSSSSSPGSVMVSVDFSEIQLLT